MKYAFINGKILDGSENMQVKEGCDLLVEDDKITEVAPSGSREGYTVVDLKGGYVCPGLINMHVHLAGNGKPQKKQRDNAKLVRTIMSSALTRAVA